MHDRIASLKEKQCAPYDYEKLRVNDWMKEKEDLKKKNTELKDIVLKFTNGQEFGKIA